jgi:hypothetical protein
LREQYVSSSFIKIIEKLLSFEHSDKQQKKRDYSVISAVASVMVTQHYSEEQAQALWLEAKKTLSAQKIDALLLKSVLLDLTSQVKQLISITELDVTH